MQTQCRFAIDRVGFLGGVSSSEIKKPAVVSQCDAEPVAISVDALISSAVVLIRSLISLLLGVSSKAHICAAAIESVPIAMIDGKFIAVRQAENLPMHGNKGSLAIGDSYTSYRIKALRPWIPLRRPFVQVERGEVFRINDGGLPLRERDFTVGFRWGCHESLLESVKCVGAETPASPLYQGVSHG